jgi:hypothetical protein
MGYKLVCFTCRKAFNQPADYAGSRSRACSDCHQPAAKLWHRFRPPRRNATKKWQIVVYLHQHGFDYNKRFASFNGHNYEKYPTTMLAAKEFVRNHTP